jgi:hypothetical protein
MPLASMPKIQIAMVRVILPLASCNVRKRAQNTNLQMRSRVAWVACAYRLARNSSLIALIFMAVLPGWVFTYHHSRLKLHASLQPHPPAPGPPRQNALHATKLSVATPLIGFDRRAIYSRSKFRNG